MGAMDGGRRCVSEEQGCRWEYASDTGVWGVTGLVVVGFVGGRRTGSEMWNSEMGNGWRCTKADGFISVRQVVGMEQVAVIMVWLETQIRMSPTAVLSRGRMEQIRSSTEPNGTPWSKVRVSSEAKHDELPHVTLGMYILHFNPNVCQNDVPLSIDFIFSNWLLMYLSDEELKTFIKKSLSWLRPGGFLFFRESCNHRSGSDPTSKLPHPQTGTWLSSHHFNSIFFLSRWHKEGVQSYILSQWCSVQSPGFLTRRRGTRGQAEVWLRHCSEKESSGLYRGKVLSNGDSFACDGV